MKLEKNYVFLPGTDKKDRKKLIVCNADKTKPPKENKNLFLPDYVILKNKKIMRLRKFARVVRRHKFKQGNNPHEHFYSELMMFRPFYSETELFEDDIDKCKDLFEESDIATAMTTPEMSKIEVVKMELFPHMVDVEEGREMVEKFEYDNNLGTDLDPKGEQQFEDEAGIGCEDAEEYFGFQPDELGEYEESRSVKPVLSDGGFQVPDIIEMDELLKSTRLLVNEQKIAMNIIVGYCKELRKSIAQKAARCPKPPLLVVHGGAGTGKSTLISVISQWAHKILRKPGDDSDCPYVIRTAPTGMAAANIEGATIHHALKLSFGNQYIALSDKNRSLLHARLTNFQ